MYSDVFPLAEPLAPPRADTPLSDLGRSTAAVAEPGRSTAAVATQSSEVFLLRRVVNESSACDCPNCDTLDVSTAIGVFSTRDAAEAQAEALMRRLRHQVWERYFVSSCALDELDDPEDRPAQPLDGRDAREVPQPRDPAEDTARRVEFVWSPAQSLPCVRV